MGQKLGYELSMSMMRGVRCEKRAPYARTKTEVVSAMMAVFVMPNWSARASDAGAIIDDETGLINVNAETIAVAAHLRLKLQLRAQ